MAGGNSRESIFKPDSVIWKITRENCILLNGPAAAVLQIAHPQIAQGVFRYSNFRGDSWGRLVRTLATVYTVTFGSREEAQALKARMIEMHRRIEVSDGKEMKTALDPDLQFWVLATLIMGSIDGYERVFGVICPADKEQFYQEMKVFGEYFGLPPDYGPGEFAEFEDYYEQRLLDKLLGSDPLCAQLAQDIAYPRSPFWLAVAMRPFKFIVIETLPRNLLGPLGFRSTAWTRYCWGVSCKLLRVIIPLLPGFLRYCRSYRIAFQK